MNIAFVHDWLIQLAGAEKVLQAIHELFPGPIYTLFKDQKSLSRSYFSKLDIMHSKLQNVPYSLKFYRNFLPFFPMAIEAFDLSEHDVIVSSSHAVAKGVLTNHEQLHICYCHTPMRYAWDLYHAYLKDAKLEKGMKSFFVKLVLHYLRNWDIKSCNRVDHFIANSKFIAARIEHIYRRKVDKVIYPPVDVEEFSFSEKKQDFYLSVCRLVPYKKVDVIVEAFNQMPNKKLVIIGTGPEFDRIKNMANANVEVLGFVNAKTKLKYLQNAKAFIQASKEDFGIAPVEALACATPVIAYGIGGAAETVEHEVSGIHFFQQSPKSLIQAIHYFESKQFDPYIIRKKSLQFKKSRFQKEMQEFINESYYSRRG